MLLSIVPFWIELQSRRDPARAPYRSLQWLADTGRALGRRCPVRSRFERRLRLVQLVLMMNRGIPIRPRIIRPQNKTHKSLLSVVGGVCFDAVDDGLGLGGRVSRVGGSGVRGGGGGAEGDSVATDLSYAALLAASLSTSQASFRRLVVASAFGLGFLSG